MRYTSYVDNSPPISQIGLGAWQLGYDSGWKKLTDSQAVTIVEKSLDLGINFFDTAPNYGKGSSELRLGKALKNKDRSQIVINSKFGHQLDGSLDFDASLLRSSIEGSLKRLQTDYLDTVLLHNPPYDLLDGNNNPHYQILEDLMEEGKINGYGASLDTAQEIEQFCRTTNGRVVEAFYNILHQGAASSFELAHEKKIKIIAKVPLDSGWLTGKFDDDSKFDGIRSRWTSTDIATRSDLVKKVKTIVGNPSNLAQIAIAFCLMHDAVTTVIPGSTDILHLTDNVKSAAIELPRQWITDLRNFYIEEVMEKNIPW